MKSWESPTKLSVKSSRLTKGVCQTVHSLILLQEVAMTAGKKAAITRRKNLVSARQRKAAFKAWRTRRANS